MLLYVVDNVFNFETCLWKLYLRTLSHFLVPKIPQFILVICNTLLYQHISKKWLIYFIYLSCMIWQKSLIFWHKLGFQHDSWLLEWSFLHYIFFFILTEKKLWNFVDVTFVRVFAKQTNMCPYIWRTRVMGQKLSAVQHFIKRLLVTYFTFIKTKYFPQFGFTAHGHIAISIKFVSILQPHLYF